MFHILLWFSVVSCQSLSVEQANWWSGPIASSSRCSRGGGGGQALHHLHRHQHPGHQVHCLKIGHPKKLCIQHVGGQQHISLDPTSICSNPCSPFVQARLRLLAGGQHEKYQQHVGATYYGQLCKRFTNNSYNFRSDATFTRTTEADILGFRLSVHF